LSKTGPAAATFVAVPAASAGLDSTATRSSADRHADASESQCTSGELRRRNAELVEENERLREAVAARDAILAVAGHELRNPMTPLLGRVQLLRRMMSKPDFPRDKVEQDLERIEWLVGQFVKRATTLLDVSRLTSGKLQLDHMPIDLHALIREVEENFRPVAEHAACELRTELPGEVVTVTGDRLALEEILENLVSNAIKYGGRTPVMVAVSSDAQRGVALIRVRDGGAGISPADQARIFERFERAVRIDERHAGFGVGLWIARQFSEAMGGKIEVTSTPGAGSTFCVTLPLQSSKEQK
jgi:signal transduction histidine kinase